MTPADGGDSGGPSLEQYVETRFNLLTETLHASVNGLRDEFHAAIAKWHDTTTAALLAADLRYQQRFEAQSDALTAAFLSQQTAMKTAFDVAEKAVNAALAAADRAVSKAELAADKRFESVNEFRKTLDDQQRTFIPRSEVNVLMAAMMDKVGVVIKQIDHLLAERAGIKGGYGYAVGVIGFILTLVSLVALGMNMMKR